jgi:hypothetical protein
VEKSKCPECGGSFAVRLDGQIRKHKCVPTASDDSTPVVSKAGKNLHKSGWCMTGFHEDHPQYPCRWPETCPCVCHEGSSSAV